MTGLYLLEIVAAVSGKDGILLMDDWNSKVREMEDWEWANAVLQEVG